MGFSDPSISGTNLVWTLVVAWMIWDLFCRRNIEWSLLLVGVVIIGSAIWDFVNFSFSLSLVFYLLEFFMFLVSYFLVRTQQSKQWFKSAET